MKQGAGFLNVVGLYPPRKVMLEGKVQKHKGKSVPGQRTSQCKVSQEFCYKREMGSGERGLGQKMFPF
jgi:hypothetical protein